MSDGNNPPPPPKATMSPETPAQAAARIAAAQPTSSTRTSAENQELREWLRQNGFPMPVSTEDMMNVAAELRKQIDAVNKAQGLLGSGSFLDRLYGAGSFAKATNKMNLLSQQLTSYAGEFFGVQGEKSVSLLLRPPEPSVQKLPTAEEFLGDYQNAFATHIEGLRSGGQLSNEEADFATNQLQNEYLQKYTARMGELAKTGVSPFTLGEITREQRGVGAGTPAGAALDKALGPGVKEPTTISGLAADVSKQAQDIGTGVSQEFTAQAVIKPLDFLTQTLSPTSIKLAYAGSQYGAGKSSRPAPSGWVSGSRRA